MDTCSITMPTQLSDALMRGELVMAVDPGFNWTAALVAAVIAFAIIVAADLSFEAWRYFG